MSLPSEAPRITPIGILKALSALRRSLVMYPAGHVVIEQTASELERVLRRTIDEYGRVRIEVIGGTAHVDGYPFRIESQANQAFLEEFEQVGVHCLQVDPGVDRDELMETAALLNDLRERPRLQHSVRQELRDRGVTDVSMSKLLPVRTQRRQSTAPLLPPEAQDAGYAEVLESARQALGPVFDGASPTGKTVRALIDRLGDQILDRRSALSEILAVKRYENHTYCHSVNVAALSLMVGRRLGLNSEALEALAEASLLHDIGKRTIPVEILNKPGPLNRREWRIMHRHPALGAEALVSNGGLSPLCATVALEHHRDFGGDGGYPDLGDSVPHLISQIVAVTDTYEALTGSRAYRAPLIPDEACVILAGMAGGKLNPDLVRIFVSLITFFPLGSVVRTSSGEVGVVVDTREHESLHPTIYTIEHEGATGSAGARIDTATRDDSGDYVRHIVEALAKPPPKLPDEAWEPPPDTDSVRDTSARPPRRAGGRRPRQDDRHPVKG